MENSNFITNSSAVFVIGFSTSKINKGMMPESIKANIVGWVVSKGEAGIPDGFTYRTATPIVHEHLPAGYRYAIADNRGVAIEGERRHKSISDFMLAVIEEEGVYL